MVIDAGFKLVLFKDLLDYVVRVRAGAVEEQRALSTVLTPEPL